MHQIHTVGPFQTRDIPPFSSLSHVIRFPETNDVQVQPISSPSQDQVRMALHQVKSSPKKSDLSPSQDQVRTWTCTSLPEPL